MKAVGWLDRLDDWINPIVVKELRQAVQSRLVVTALLLYLGLQVFCVGLFLMVREAQGGPDGIDWRAGARIFPWLQAFLLMTCTMLIPAYTAVRLASERSDTNVDLLFISTLRPTSIVTGKFLAALVLAMLVFSACAPFMTFTYLMRGLDMPTILLMLGIDVLGVLLGTQVALFLGALPAQRAVKFLVTFLGFLLLAVLYGMVTSGTQVLLMTGVDLTSAPRDIWALVGAVVLLVALAVGLLFCWTVALISPPSSNRAPAGRLFLGLGLALLGVLAALWSAHHRGVGQHGPMYAWCVLSVLLFGVQLVVSSNERTSWGTRAARSIPRRLWLRLPAFLLSSGAAGGMLFALGGMGLALLANELWRQHYPTMPGAAVSETFGRFAALLALYAYCYVVTGALLRSYLLKGRVPQQATWVVTTVLMGAGSSLPYLIAYLFFADHLREYAGSEWWLVANPFVVLYEVFETRSTPVIVEWGFNFTILWGVLLAGLSAPWFFRQVVRFQPAPPREKKEAVPVPEISAPVIETGATSMQTG